MAEKKKENKKLAEELICVVEGILEKYSLILLKMALNKDRGEIKNIRHTDNFLSNIDLKIHNEYLKKIRPILPSFIYASEEADPVIVGGGKNATPELMVLVDPLDTSELAVRGLYGYTHLLVYSLKKQYPIISIVGDMFNTIKVYFAFLDRNGNIKSYLKTRNNKVHLLNSSRTKVLNRALITNYSLPPVDRFMKVARKTEFLKALGKLCDDGRSRGRLGVDFGSIGLCHIAAGLTDGMIEIAKGFALWDLIPGQFILNGAGGSVKSLVGEDISMNLSIDSLADVRSIMKKRQKFVASGNEILLKKILGLIK